MEAWTAVDEFPETPPETPPEALAHGPRPTAFHALFAVGGLLLVVNLLYGLYAGFVQVFLPDSAQAQDLRDSLGVGSTADLYLQTLLSLVLFAVVPMAWAYGTRVRPWPGGHRYLGLRDPGPALWRGALLGLGLMLSVLLASLLWIAVTEGPDALTEEPEEDENPVVQALLEHLTVPLALFIAFTAGFGEEVLFRGVLQKWVGWWPQAILFGLSHAAGGEVLQILVTTLVGLLFGYLVHRGHSLWLVIAAHFTYDAGLLLSARLAA